MMISNSSYKIIISFSKSLSQQQKFQFKNLKQYRRQMTENHLLEWKQVVYNNQNPQVPEQRWGHRMIKTSSHELLVFGGFGGQNSDGRYLQDLWKFNTFTHEWMQINTTGQLPQKRSNYTLHYDSFSNQVLLFGGGSQNKQRFNTLSILDLETNVWKKLIHAESDQAPWERTYHSSEYVRPYLIMFGGEGVSNMDLNDMWVLDTRSGVWNKIQFSSDELPKRRRFHGTAMIGNQFYVIGGCFGNYSLLGDIYKVDLTKLFQQNIYVGFEWKCLTTKNKILERWGHSCDVFEQKIYICAGRVSANNDNNDLYVFDPKKNTLTEIAVEKATLPKARRRHASAFIGSTLLIFGGYNGNYMKDFNFITIPTQFKSKKEIRLNVLKYDCINQYLQKINKYQKKISSTISMELQYFNEKIQIYANKNILEQNQFFNNLFKYQSNAFPSIILPQFSTIQMFRCLNLAINEKDLLLCKQFSLQYLTNLIKTFEYFCAEQYITSIELFLIAQLNHNNCNQMLELAINLNLINLINYAAQIYLKSGNKFSYKKCHEGFSSKQVQSAICLNKNTHSKENNLEKTTDNSPKLSKQQQRKQDILLLIINRLRFDIDQTKLRQKSVNFIERTALKILSIFNESSKECPIKVELADKQTKQRSCLDKFCNFITSIVKLSSSKKLKSNQQHVSN